MKTILDGHKLNWHTDRLIRWCNGEKFAPVTIDMALTRRCSYRCTYCYGRLQGNEEQEITLEVIRNFIDDAADIGVKGISLVSDGESTCSPHVYEAIIYGAKRGLSMALGTNGYLLRDDMLKEVLPSLTYLRFNISAGEAGRYAEIHGCSDVCFTKVCHTILQATRRKHEARLPVTIGAQMVLMPEFADQIIPLTQLCSGLGVDYLVIKHCSDDEHGSLGVNYEEYFPLVDMLKEAESYSRDGYQVEAKWSKILSGGKRSYKMCFGPPFLLQISGSGLVAPCGMLFGEDYKKYHIGNIVTTRFKDIWNSPRYWEVMRLLKSKDFDAQEMCGCLCLQHKVNEYLWDVCHGKENIHLTPTGEKTKAYQFCIAHSILTRRVYFISRKR